jgi:hypothetical protein
MDKPDLLSELALKYLTDKCPQIKHPFTPFYFELLKDKQKSIKKVLEIGVGYPEMSNTRPHRLGASLFMWRDFFPNAQIYGADIYPGAIFTDNRIETFLRDQTNKEDLEKLIGKIGSDIDLVVDDGSHKTKDQIFTCLTSMPLLKNDVIYIIEDVTEPEAIAAALDMYNCQIPNLRRRFRDDNVIVVTHK